MIKFSQESLRKFTPQTAQWLGHTLEISETQSLVSALQQAKQGLLVVFCIPGANGDCCQVCFSVFLFVKSLLALAFILMWKGVEVLIMLYGEKNSGQVLLLRTHIIQTIGLTSLRGPSRKAKLLNFRRKFCHF